jgi:hypothetical protein
MMGMRIAAVAACYRRRFLARGVWRTVGMAIVCASIVGRAAHAEESVVAKITVSASLAASYFGEQPIEGLMDFRGRKYLLTLDGPCGPVSSVGSVFGLRRARDIVGPYTLAADGFRNPAGVTIRFDPPLALRDASLKIELASLIYPKVSTGQGNDLE